MQRRKAPEILQRDRIPRNRGARFATLATRGTDARAGQAAGDEGSNAWQTQP